MSARIGCLHQPDVERCPICSGRLDERYEEPVTEPMAETPPEPRSPVVAPRRLRLREVVTLLALGAAVPELLHSPVLIGLAEVVLVVTAVDWLRRMLLRHGARH